MNFKELGDTLGLEEDEYRDLVALFITTGSADIQALQAALSAGDQDGAVQKAHTIKGAAGNLGLTDIHQTAEHIEQQAVEGKWADAAPMVEAMQHQMEALEAQMGK